MKKTLALAAVTALLWPTQAGAVSRPTPPAQKCTSSTVKVIEVVRGKRRVTVITGVSCPAVRPPAPARLSRGTW